LKTTAAIAQDARKYNGILTRLHMKISALTSIVFAAKGVSFVRISKSIPAIEKNARVVVGY